MVMAVRLQFLRQDHAIPIINIAIMKSHLFLFDAFRIKNHSEVNLRGCSVKEATERYNAITAWRNKQYLSQKSKPVFSIQFVMNIVRQFKIYTYANKLFIFVQPILNIGCRVDFNCSCFM